MSQSSNLDLELLIPLYIGANTSSSHVPRSQLTHRINLVKNIWKIPSGSSVLEIGCGQGDCTLVLAAAVGQAGHVDAVDPCLLEYGAPFTVGESQSFLQEGALGSRMTFIQADPMDYIPRCGKVYDYVVLNNCLWYFSVPALIQDLLALLAPKSHVKHILVAEWSLQAHSLASVPHVLAALARASVELLDTSSTANIRTVVSPQWITQWMEQCGAEVKTEEWLETPREMADGKWEVESVLTDRFLEKLGRLARSEGERAILRSMQDAVWGAVQAVDGGIEGVQCMLIWAAMF